MTDVIELLINGSKLYMNFEEYKTHQRFMDYKELLLELVGMYSDEETISKANKYIFDNFERYREFIPQ